MRKLNKYKEKVMQLATGLDKEERAYENETRKLQKKEYLKAKREEMLDLAKKKAQIQKQKTIKKLEQINQRPYRDPFSKTATMEVLNYSTKKKSPGKKKKKNVVQNRQESFDVIGWR